MYLGWDWSHGGLAYGIHQSKCLLGRYTITDWRCPIAIRNVFTTTNRWWTKSRVDQINDSDGSDMEMLLSSNHLFWTFSSSFSVLFRLLLFVVVCCLFLFIYMIDATTITSQSKGRAVTLHGHDRWIKVHDPHNRIFQSVPWIGTHPGRQYPQSRYPFWNECCIERKITRSNHWATNAG